MIRNAAFSTFFILVMLMSGCSKPERAPLPENVLRLTNGNFKDWRLEKVRYIIINVTNRIPECKQDEIYRFYADGRGEILSGPNPCNEGESEIQTTGTWEFTGQGETIIVRWKDGVNWEAKVDELQPDKLVVTGIVFDNYEVTATFAPVL